MIILLWPRGDLTKILTTFNIEKVLFTIVAIENIIKIYGCNLNNLSINLHKCSFI